MTAGARPSLPYVFIGDDFTGASDTLATLASSGRKTRLYLKPPELDEVRDAGLDAAGIATEVRSLPPDEMTRQIDALAPSLMALSPRIVHYKVCSTFDSAPHVGSIGAVVLRLEQLLRPAFVAIIGGQPSLGRYCTFGNLFARASDGCVYRIDRHPVMKCHPTTPMTEADLRLHLAGQDLAGIRLVDLQAISLGQAALEARLEHDIRRGHRRFLFDVADQDQLRTIGAVLNSYDPAGFPILMVGASSVAEAFAPEDGSLAWREASAKDAERSGPCLTVAGSRSSVTANQVSAAGAYWKRPVTAADLADEAGLERLGQECCDALAGGRNVLAHLLPEADYGLSGSALSERLARLTGIVMGRVPIRCLGVAGGDTSSIVARQLGLDSLTFDCRLGQGVAICTAKSSLPERDGMRVMFKGGQVGGPDIFDAFLRQ
jgi:uncharacterized protein YgbK (DUF1537 family)